MKWLHADRSKYFILFVVGLLLTNIWTLSVNASLKHDTTSLKLALKGYKGAFRLEQRKVEELVRQIAAKEATITAQGAETERLRHEIEVSRSSQFRCQYSDLLWKYYGKQAPLAHRVMVAESGCNPGAKNSHSSASGLYQIIESTWKRYSPYPWVDRFDPEKNIHTASIIALTSGWQHWNASKHNWRR